MPSVIAAAPDGQENATCTVGAVVVSPPLPVPLVASEPDAPSADPVLPVIELAGDVAVGGSIAASTCSCDR